MLASAFAPNYGSLQRMHAYNGRPSIRIAGRGTPGKVLTHPRKWIGIFLLHRGQNGS